MFKEKRSKSFPMNILIKHIIQLNKYRITFYQLFSRVYRKNLDVGNRFETDLLQNTLHLLYFHIPKYNKIITYLNKKKKKKSVSRKTGEKHVSN